MMTYTIHQPDEADDLFEVTISNGSASTVRRYRGMNTLLGALEDIIRSQIPKGLQRRAQLN